jgi:hypothetical protein
MLEYLAMKSIRCRMAGRTTRPEVHEVLVLGLS